VGSMDRDKQLECPLCGTSDSVMPIESSPAMKRVFPDDDYYCDRCGLAGKEEFFLVVRSETSDEVSRVIDALLGAD